MKVDEPFHKIPGSYVMLTLGCESCLKNQILSQHLGIPVVSIHLQAAIPLIFQIGLPMIGAFQKVGSNTVSTSDKSLPCTYPSKKQETTNQ